MRLIMELSKKDRIVLINQYRILSYLDSNEAEHYKELIDILENGYQIFYSLIDQWVSEDMPEEKGKFVLDVLSMYRAIEDFKRKNKSELVSGEYFSFFRGFDGNEETEHMSFTRFLIEIQGKFSEQKPYLKDNDNLNSHMPTIEKYKSMLAEWNSLGKAYQLTEEQVMIILQAERG